MSKNSEIEEMLKKMVIRPIRKKDFDQLFELINKSFREQTRFTGLDLQRLSRIAKLRRLIGMLRPLFDAFHRDFEIILVAASGNRLIGEIQLVPLGKKIWNINSIAVDSKFRRCGIGSRLTKEALRYVSERNGKKVSLHVWTDNFPALKIYKKFSFAVFEKEILLLCELLRKPIIKIETDDDVLIREVKPDDISHIRKIFEAVKPKKMQEYKIAPEDFRDSIFSHIKSRMAWACSKKWVLEMHGEILGYTHVMYVPRQKAGKIESFYVLPSDKSSELTSISLNKVLEFLATRNIKRVIASLNEEWKETIHIFEGFGFKPIASVYRMIKELG